MKTVAFIGGGRITKIFLQAFKNCTLEFKDILVYDINAETLLKLKASFPHVTTIENLNDMVQADFIFLALHPPVIPEILEHFKEKLDEDSLIISLAPKITLTQMNKLLNGFYNIARMNPSASSIVNKGVNPVAFASEVSDKKKADFLEMVGKMGYTPEVDESKIEAYAVISAMGHTYFFFQLNKLKDLAVKFGMEEKEAKSVLGEMIEGTSKTLFQSGMSFSEINDLVPVKPLAEVEETIKSYYDQFLTGVFNKIKPA